MTPEQLLALFEQTAAAIKDALDTVKGVDLRDRTSRPGQYALDLVADKAALEILNDAPVTIVSEESGVGPQSSSGITVVIDPVDGSSNAARGIPYWATSLCALDAQGPLAAMVINQATGVSSTATRGGGAFRDGVSISVSSATKAEEAVDRAFGIPGSDARVEAVPLDGIVRARVVRRRVRRVRRIHGRRAACTRRGTTSADC